MCIRDRLQVIGCSPHFRLRGGGLQAGIAGIEFGQQLATAHAVAGIDKTLHHVAANAERERGFLACANFTCVGAESGLRAAGRMHHQHRCLLYTSRCV